MNQITKVDCNAFLWESEFGHVGLLYHFRGDSTLVSWIANVRDWSKQKNSRFRQRLRYVFKRWNHNDFHKFSWSQADFLFSTLKSQFYRPAPTTQRQKNPCFCFQWSKISSSSCGLSQMAISQLWEKPSYLLEFVHFITNPFLFCQFSLEQISVHIW